MTEQPPPRLQLTTQRARALRRDATPAERRLWYELRALELPVKVRRQHPVGEYITDFAIPAARVIIELDGDTHVANDERDVKRTAFIESKGWRVLRFWNSDVMQNTDGVLGAIVDAVRSR